ncbi:type I methionyl aminopeptidase [Patescibacteria group bacterium]|nr:type I methionyl aminopeptidase [Patescibacteria group bacterium]
MNQKVSIKSEKEIKIMRQAGQILSEIMNRVAQEVRPGLVSSYLDELAEKLIKDQGAQPAFKGYGSKKNPFPATLCVSVNEEVVHGIPSSEKILQEGDIVGLDCGLKYQGYFSDMAMTVPVGKVSKRKLKLMRVTRDALYQAISVVKAGVSLGTVSAAIQEKAVENNLGVVRNLTGHGIGKELHEPPVILNYGRPRTGLILKEGMTFCLEPMFNQGDWAVKTKEDGWTVVTRDNSCSAHFEHMILVTKKGSRILTKGTVPSS